MRVQINDTRVATLSAIHATETAFLRLAQNWRATSTDDVIARNVIARQIRRWIPADIEKKWAERDARKVIQTPIRQRRTAFNPPRVIFVAA